MVMVLETIQILPLNDRETLDSDGDGVGDNSDKFPYDETNFWIPMVMVLDNSQYYPLDSTRQASIVKSHLICLWFLVHLYS